MMVIWGLPVLSHISALGFPVRSSHLPRMVFFSTSSMSKAFAKVTPNLATISGIYKLLWVLEENVIFYNHKLNLTRYLTVEVRLQLVNSSCIWWEGRWDQALVHGIPLPYQGKHSCLGHMEKSPVCVEDSVIPHNVLLQFAWTWPSEVLAARTHAGHTASLRMGHGA